MENLIQAIQSEDFLKVKKIFNECMAERVESVIQERKIALAKTVMVEGETEAIDDEDEEDGDDEDEDEDDK